jgi:putative Holliday junction resolvase
MVMGLPTDLRGNMSGIEIDILEFIEKAKKHFPEVKIHRLDERFTSKMASFLSQSGKNKKQRQEKALIDKISATIILQNF